MRANSLLRASLLLAFLVSLVSGCAKPADTFIAPARAECLSSERDSEPLRVVSYNIRAARSSSLEDIAKDLEELAPDVVALQEVDRETPRADGVDQAAWLADRLGMQFAYAATRTEGDGDFGVALLSRLPFASAQRIGLDSNGSLEPRAAIDAELCTAGGPVHVVGVHADVWPWASEAQTRQLAAHVEPYLGKGVIVAGDLNAPPDWKTPGILAGLGLVDVVGRLSEAPTFQGDLWKRRIDYLFMDAPLASAATAATVLESRASDHLPVLVEMNLAGSPLLAGR